MICDNKRDMEIMSERVRGVVRTQELKFFFGRGDIQNKNIKKTHKQTKRNNNAKNIGAIVERVDLNLYHYRVVTFLDFVEVLQEAGGRIHNSWVIGSLSRPQSVTQTSTGSLQVYKT